MNSLQIYFDKNHSKLLEKFRRLEKLRKLVIKSHLQETIECQSDITSHLKKTLPQLEHLEFVLSGISKEKFLKDAIDSSSIFWTKITKLSMITNIESLITISKSASIFRSLKSLRFTSLLERDESSRCYQIDFLTEFSRLTDLKLNFNISFANLIHGLMISTLPK